MALYLSVAGWMRSGANMQASPDRILTARTVILATGTENRRPPIDDQVHRTALDRGQLRYCPVCDGFEATGQALGILGGDAHGVAEALFLRTYSDDITLVAMKKMELESEDRALLADAGIKVMERPTTKIEFRDKDVIVNLDDGQILRFDTLYPALGSDSNNTLAAQLGVDMSDGCCIDVDKKQRTSVKGIYAAGDIVLALDQISVAMGHAAIAATTLHNDLRETERHSDR